MHLHAMAREAVKTTDPVLLAVDRGEPARAMMSTFCLSTGGRASDPILPGRRTVRQRRAVDCAEHKLKA